MQRECPAYPQVGWANSGCQGRALDDPVKGHFGRLTTVDPAPKKKEDEEKRAQEKASSNTFNGFKFFDPSLIDEDIDDNDDDDDADEDHHGP